MERGTNSRASSGTRYEIFLNFQGDTRYEFTEFLYRGMVDAGILVFRDAESLRVGKRIGGELLQAIEQSDIYIPIFSKKFASSRWCLRELAYIVECTLKSNENKEILPIFLNVEPADVKLRTNLYTQALSKHPEKFSTEVKSWESALIEVGERKGWNWKKGESQADLIQSVIQTVLVKLNVKFKKNVTKDLVGVEDRVEAITKMLDVESDSVQFLGIHGMGGIGKTTLAKAIFNKLSSRFQGSNFLSDIGESSRRHGLVYLQKQLLSKFLDSRSIDQIYDVDEGIDMIKRVLCNKKVLIVLDDMDDKEQLKSLVEKVDWLGSGSRLIITTRDQRVLLTEGEATSEGSAKKPTKVSTYEVQEMEYGHALNLFSRHAFRRDFPPDDYVSLSNEVVITLGKFPLALEVIGSSLNNKPKEFWEDTLDKLKDAPPNEVQSRLMITYDRLDHAQKQIFLDIACFFVNEDKTYPFYMWDACGYHPHVAIEALFLMSFIKIKDDKTFWMHDQVRDLGREIVRRENYEDPYERSRIWNPEEVWSILKRKEGSRKIKALSLGFDGLSHQDDLTHDEFANLRELRFFRGSGASLIGEFNNLLSNLRWLSCRYCPSKFEATKLVILDLSCSEISEENIEGIKGASELKVLDLSYCHYLRKTPDLSTLISLERLNLRGCRQLIEIDPSISKLKLLTTLNLDGCNSLRELPEEIGCLQALTEIIMPNTLHEIPEMFGNLKSLLTFDVPNREIGKLPCSIGGLVKIRRLDISKCAKIKELPHSVGKLQFLVELDLSWTCIGHLPDSVGNLKQLTVLRMRGIQGMTKFPSALWLLEKLEELDAGGCSNLTGEIPEEIGRLSCLRILDLSDTCITGLPTMMSCLSNLQELELDPCHKLRHLPELPASLTRLTWSDSVELKSASTLSTNIGTLSQLKKLTLASPNLRILPQLPSSLRELQLRDLATTQPADFSNLKSLSTLELNGCTMSEFSGIIDAELDRFLMSDCTFRRLDALFQLQMERLTSFTLLRCEFLPEACDLSHMKNLQEVHLCECKLLVEIRGLEELESLSSLKVQNCSMIERMSDISKLRKLRSLTVEECPKLRSIEGVNHLESLKYLWIYNCETLESLADTSNLDLECSRIVGCKRLCGRHNFCKYSRICDCRWFFKRSWKSEPMKVRQK